jgi:hypothetical protein
VGRNCRVFRLYLCVIVIFICESNVCGEDRLRGFILCLCLIVIFICEGSAQCEGRLLGI